MGEKSRIKDQGEGRGGEAYDRHMLSPACWPGTTINKYGNSRRENSSIESSIRFESIVLCKEKKKGGVLRIYSKNCIIESNFEI